MKSISFWPRPWPRKIALYGRKHDIAEFSTLQDSLVDQASEWAGEPLESSYNFLSLYTRMGVCNPHLDSPSAKWTLDLCIDQSEPWPIHLSQVVPWPDKNAQIGENWTSEIKEDRSLNFSASTLNPGDAILFSGSSQWHYRDALPRDGGKRYCDLLFMPSQARAGRSRPAGHAASIQISA